MCILEKYSYEKQQYVYVGMYLLFDKCWKTKINYLLNAFVSLSASTCFFLLFKPMTYALIRLGEHLKAYSPFLGMKNRVVTRVLRVYERWNKENVRKAYTHSKCVKKSENFRKIDHISFKIDKFCDFDEFLENFEKCQLLPKNWKNDKIMKIC